jgi:hypothetical protein
MAEHKLHDTDPLDATYLHKTLTAQVKKNAQLNFGVL